MSWKDYLLKEDDDDDEDKGKIDIPEKDVINFFKENPNPSDDELHNWAEDKGYNVHKVEEIVYKLATRMVKILTGGEAEKKGITEKDVDSKQLKMGIKVEYEHIHDDEIAKEIALDHLAELPDYYTRLKKMEEEAKKELGI